MFFKKKEKAPEKRRLLEKKNIRVNCRMKDKAAVIREAGKMLFESGYVNETYADAMLKREETFATCIGNGIALPHGVEEAKKDIHASGICVMVFPEGLDWGGELVKLVIGIAGVGEEHLAILSKIAEHFMEPDAVEKLTGSSVDDIYELLGGEEA